MQTSMFKLEFVDISDCKKNDVFTFKPQPDKRFIYHFFKDNHHHVSAVNSNIIRRFPYLPTIITPVKIITVKRKV